NRINIDDFAKNAETRPKQTPKHFNQLLAASSWLPANPQLPRESSTTVCVPNSLRSHLPKGTRPASKSLDADTVPACAAMTAIALGIPPSNSATSLQPASLLMKTLKKSATSPQQLRNSATSQQTSF